MKSHLACSFHRLQSTTLLKMQISTKLFYDPFHLRIKSIFTSPAAMVSPGSGSWAYTTSPRASAAYLDMPTVPGNEHIYYVVFTHPLWYVNWFVNFLSLCIPVGCPSQPIINRGKDVMWIPNLSYEMGGILTVPVLTVSVPKWKRCAINHSYRFMKFSF